MLCSNIFESEFVGAWVRARPTSGRQGCFQPVPKQNKGRRKTVVVAHQLHLPRFSGIAGHYRRLSVLKQDVVVAI
jgi:hypothetical protein